MPCSASFTVFFLHAAWLLHVACWCCFKLLSCCYGKPCKRRYEDTRWWWPFFLWLCIYKNVISEIMRESFGMCMCIYRRLCVVWKHCDAEPSSNKFVGSLYCIHIGYMVTAATAAFSVVDCALCLWCLFSNWLFCMRKAKSVCVGGMQPNRHHRLLSKSLRQLAGHVNRFLNSFEWNFYGFWL